MASELNFKAQSVIPKMEKKTPATQASTALKPYCWPIKYVGKTPSFSQSLAIKPITASSPSINKDGSVSVGILMRIPTTISIRI